MRIRPATPEDLDAVFALLTARERAAFGRSELERPHLEQAWRLGTTDRWVAENDALVGYAALDATQDVDVAAGDAPVGKALLRTVAERARERGFDHLTAIVSRRDVQLDALVRRSGFEQRGEVLRMWRALDGGRAAPPLPDGISLRTYRDADARRVQRLLEDAYAGWDESHVARSHDDWLQWMTGHDEFDPAFWLVAERDGELVGCALNWAPREGAGWVKDLVVRADERSRGLGSALLQATFAAYAARGARRVGLKVDSTNPTGAPRLYERVGFTTDRREGIWVKAL